MQFGDFIAAERKAKGMSQKDLASRILKEDGSAISPQYLNDLERQRRNPPSDYIIERFAAVLEVDRDYLFYLAGQISPDLRDDVRSEKEVRDALVAFRRALKRVK